MSVSNQCVAVKTAGQQGIAEPGSDYQVKVRNDQIQCSAMACCVSTQHVSQQTPLWVLKSQPLAARPGFMAGPFAHKEASAAAAPLGRSSS